MKRPEGKTLKCKRDLSSPDGELKTIVAFAKTAGGTQLIGVEDGSRHVRGVIDALDLEERLANLVGDRISPRIVPEIEILPWRRTQVLAVQVHPTPSRPHHLIREGPAAGAYVRVGSTNRRADSELIEELRRFARGGGFENQPMPGLDSAALDFRAASDSFAPFRKLARRDLRTLRLVTDHQGRRLPTVGGMILFGKERERASGRRYRSTPASIGGHANTGYGAPMTEPMTEPMSSPTLRRASAHRVHSSRWEVGSLHRFGDERRSVYDLASISSASLRRSRAGATGDGRGRGGTYPRG